MSGLYVYHHLKIVFDDKIRKNKYRENIISKMPGESFNGSLSIYIILWWQIIPDRQQQKGKAFIGNGRLECSVLHLLLSVHLSGSSQCVSIIHWRSGQMQFHVSL